MREHVNCPAGWGQSSLPDSPSRERHARSDQAQRLRHHEHLLRDLRLQRHLFRDLPPNREAFGLPPQRLMERCHVARHIWASNEPLTPGGRYGRIGSPLCDPLPSRSNGYFRFKISRGPYRLESGRDLASVADAIRRSDYTTRQHKHLHLDKRHCVHAAFSGRVSQLYCYLTSSRCRPTLSQCNLAAGRCRLTSDQCQPASNRCHLTSGQCQLAAARCQVTSSQCHLAASRCWLTSDRCQPAISRGCSHPWRCWSAAVHRSAAA